MVELDRPLRARDPRHVADARERAIRRAQLQIGEARGVFPKALIASDDDRRPLLPFRHDTRAHPLDLSAQGILHLVDRHSEPPGRCAVDVELKIVHAVVGDRQHFRGTANARQRVLDLAGEIGKRIEVGAEDLDREIAARTGQHL